MIRPAHNDISGLFAAGTPIDNALRLAARDAYIRHKQAGVPIVVWRDGKVVEIPPEEIVIPPELPSKPRKRAAARKRKA